MDIHVVIGRRLESTQTPGCLYVFNQDSPLLILKTLELPWKNNAREESCIPSGTYDCERIQHPKFGICFYVKNVPGREGILFHAGNFASGNKVDTEGCILPGLKFADINNDGLLDITGSSKAMDLLRAVLPDRFKLTIL